ncbi:HEXXH motif domain-containing protein [Streptomyces puniciscabiei]
MSQNEFAALAAGRGGPEIITKLRAGQTSKHIVMILSAMEQARTLDPEAFQAMDTAYELLVSAQQTAPDEINVLLAHPQVGLWAANCLRRTTGVATDLTFPLEAELTQLGAVAAVAGIIADLDFRIEVPLRDGTLLLPTLGLARFDSNEPVGQAIVERDATTVLISFGQQTIVVPADPSERTTNWVGLRWLRSGSSETAISIEFVDFPSAADNASRSAPPEVDDSRWTAWQQVFDEAWQILINDHPDHAREMIAGLVGIVARSAHGDYRSSTQRDAFGYFEAVFPSDALSFAETLVHEFQHSKLYATNDLFQLYDLETGEIYFAPWRQDARPIEGLFHGVYAFQGITSFWEVNRRRMTGNEYLRSCFEFARWRYQVEAAIDVLVESGHLTEAGLAFAQGMRTTVAAWHEVTVPDEAQRLADQIADEHRVFWRLRNLHPDKSIINSLAASWLDGDECPAKAQQIVVDIKSDQQIQRHFHLELMQLRLAHPDRFTLLCADREAMAAASFPEITDADIAYLQDDYAAARELYVNEIVKEPARYQHWAGLAVACNAESTVAGEVLKAVPELVYAVYLELQRRTALVPDVTAIAAWLAPQLSLTPAQNRISSNY